MTPDPNRLIFGANPLSTLPSRRAAFRLLEAAGEVGIRHVDTARAYGRGYSEKLIGEFIRAHGPAFRLTVKVGLGGPTTSALPAAFALPLNHWRRRLRGAPRPDEPIATTAVVPRPSRLSHDDVKRSLDETFRLIGSTTVDTLLLHENLPTNLDDRTLEALLSLVEDGTVGRLGIGIDAAVLAAHYEPVKGFSVLQYDGTRKEYGFLERFPDAIHIQFGFLHRIGEEDAASALAAAQKANPSGKVLFATRRTDRVRSNVLGSQTATR